MTSQCASTRVDALQLALAMRYSGDRENGLEVQLKNLGGKPAVVLSDLADLSSTAFLARHTDGGFRVLDNPSAPIAGTPALTDDSVEVLKPNRKTSGYIRWSSIGLRATTPKRVVVRAVYSARSAQVFLQSLDINAWEGSVLSIPSGWKSPRMVLSRYSAEVS